ncbi:MAG TPA: alpha/beta fold hydrolase [Polyangiaceae bacterium]|nr:alpha/beta fold hydrolase [Polyangiaceae bacterium]
MQKRPLIWLAGGALGAAFALAPIAGDLERHAMDDAARERARAAGLPGAFVTLPEGVVHYELAGPEGAPTVVLIHGASGPMTVWDHTAGALRGAGLRVLRYDLFGRGYSDRPDAAYDEPFYHAQLEHLLDALGVAGPVALVGSSMGAAIAAGYALERPERVSRVALIGPAGFPLEATPVAKLARAPLAGEYLMRAFGGRELLAHNRRYLARPEAAPELHAAVREQASYRGLGRAILATMRHFPLEDMAASYAALGRSGKPILLAWGRHDQTFPFSHSERARALMPGAAFVAVDDAAHLPQYERPDVVNPALLRFLTAGG